MSSKGACFLFTAPLEVIQVEITGVNSTSKNLKPNLVFSEIFFTAISSVPCISLPKALNVLLSNPSVRGYQMYD